MSLLVFPTVAGITWPANKRPKFSTEKFISQSGKQQRLQNYFNPLWEIDLAYEYLKDGTNLGYQTILAFFMAMAGSFGTFALDDPFDDTITNEQIGTGDGVTTRFQITRSILGSGITFKEAIQLLNGTPQVKVAGSIVSPSFYTISAIGEVVFDNSHIPTGGQSVVVNGNFYFRVHFVDDIADFENFQYKLWKLGKLSMESDPL